MEIKHFLPMDLGDVQPLLEDQADAGKQLQRGNK